MGHYGVMNESVVSGSLDCMNESVSEWVIVTE
jgi:hypothetical protein